MIILKQILRIAREILALNKWIKVKNSPNGWKRQKPDGGFEYRYQDTNPNIKKTPFKKELPTSDEINALSVYTQVGYIGINRYLRGKGLPAKQTVERIEKINSLLDKIPDHKETVYRGMNLRYDPYVYKFLQSLNAGDVLKSKGFLSTSKDFATAKGFSGLSPETGVFFEIKPQHGKDISKFSSFVGAEEEEVLFKPNTNFQVVSINKTSNVLVIKLIEVKKEPKKIPIKDMTPLGLKKALLKKKNLKEEDYVLIESLSDYVLSKLIKYIIQKNGPYYTI